MSQRRVQPRGPVASRKNGARGRHPSDLPAECARRLRRRDQPLDGGDVVVAVRGELDVLTAPFLWERMEPALAGVDRRAGLRLRRPDLHRLDGSRGPRPGPVPAAGRGAGAGIWSCSTPTPMPARCFEITGLDRILDVQPWSRGSASTSPGGSSGTWRLAGRLAAGRRGAARRRVGPPHPAGLGRLGLSRGRRRHRPARAVGAPGPRRRGTGGGGAPRRRRRRRCRRSSAGPTPGSAGASSGGATSSSGPGGR